MCLLDSRGIILYLTEMVASFFFKTPEEHIRRLKPVFRRFCEANLKISQPKCAFLQKKVQILGHLISENGLEADPEKVDAVEKFPIPQNQIDVKSF